MTTPRAITFAMVSALAKIVRMTRLRCPSHRFVAAVWVGGSLALASCPVFSVDMSWRRGIFVFVLGLMCEARIVNSIQESGFPPKPRPISVWTLGYPVVLGLGIAVVSQRYMTVSFFGFVLVFTASTRIVFEIYQAVSWKLFKGKHLPSS